MRKLKENNGGYGPGEEDLLGYAQRRMGEMNRAAADLVEALGLPPAAKHDALAVMFGGAASPAAQPLADQGPVLSMAPAAAVEMADGEDEGVTDTGPAGSDNVAWLHLWVKALRELDRQDEALKGLAIALTVPRGDAADFQNCAVEAEGLGAFDVAIKLYQRSLQLDPDDPRKWLNYADCLSKVAERGGNSEALEQAEAIFAKVVAQSPDDARASSFYLDHLMRQGQLDAAKSQLEHLRQLALNNPIPDAARLYLGDLYSYHARLGIPKESIEKDLSELVGSLQGAEAVTEAEKGRLAVLWAALASLYVSLDNLEGATSAYAQAAALDLMEPRALGNLAVHLNMRLRAPQLAANVWRLALESTPEDLAVWEQFLSALSHGAAIPPETMLKLLQTRSGRKRLGLVSEALGPLPERREILNQAQEALRGRELAPSVEVDAMPAEDEKKLREPESRVVNLFRGDDPAPRTRRG